MQEPSLHINELECNYSHYINCSLYKHLGHYPIVTIDIKASIPLLGPFTMERHEEDYLQKKTDFVGHRLAKMGHCIEGRGGDGPVVEMLHVEDGLRGRKIKDKEINRDQNESHFCSFLLSFLLIFSFFC